MGLIPSIPYSQFRLLKARDLKRLKSAEITSDGEYLFTFVNAQTDYIRIQVESLSLLSNSQGGVELEEIKEMVNV